MKLNILKKIKLSFCKERKLYFDLYELLGFYPNDVDLYKQAFLHKSLHYKDSTGNPINNERLEFLGDAILGAVVGDIVFNHFPIEQEGFLTKTRSRIVSRNTLNSLAQKLNLNKFIHYQGVYSKNGIPGNAFEALIGAIYLDHDFITCKKFMEERIFNGYINLDVVAENDTNYKSMIVEWAQHYGYKLDFVMLREEHKDNNMIIFKSQVFVDGNAYGVGSGICKKTSQQEAAKNTLEMFKKDAYLLETVKIAHKEKNLEIDVIC